MPESRRPATRLALVLGGGGILGAAWEIGILKAIEDRVGAETLRDSVDLLVGSSAGSFVASWLAHGVSPSDLYAALSEPDGTPWFPVGDIYRVDVGRLVRGGFAVVGGMLGAALRPLLRGRITPPLDVFRAGLDRLPAGFLRIEPLARRTAALFAERGLADDFAATATPLLVPALDIDRGQRVLFGARAAHERRGLPLLPDAPRNDPPISLAVTASSAIPRLFGAVDVNGAHCVDGDIGGAMHVDAALDMGARRVLAISPVVASCLPAADGSDACRPVSGAGLGVLLDQCSRIEQEAAVLHAVDAARLRWPAADIVLLRPRRDMMPAADSMSFEGHRDVLRAAHEGLAQLDRAVLARLDALFRPSTDGKSSEESTRVE